MNNYELTYKEGRKRARVIISYSRGKLRRIDQRAGNIDFSVLKKIPLKEDEIGSYPIAIGITITRLFNKAKDDVAFFTPATRAWSEFYEQHTGGLLYRFGAGDAMALKNIGKHLIKVAGGVEEALDAWKYILKNWNKLDDFYRNNVDLKFINSQLNKILNLMKNGQQTSAQAARNIANDFRQRFNS